MVRAMYLVRQFYQILYGNEPKLWIALLITTSSLTQSMYDESSPDMLGRPIELLSCCQNPPVA